MPHHYLQIDILGDKGVSKNLTKFEPVLDRKSRIPSAQKIGIINSSHAECQKSERMVSIQAGVSAPSILNKNSCSLLTPMALKSRRNMTPNKELILSKNISRRRLSKNLSDAAAGQDSPDNDDDSIRLDSGRPKGLNKSSIPLTPDQDLKISGFEEYAMKEKETKKIGFASTAQIYEFSKFKSTSPVAKQLFLGQHNTKIEEDLKKNERFLTKSNSVKSSYDKIRKNIETQWDECNKSNCITQLKPLTNPVPYFQSYNSSYCGDLIKKIKDKLKTEKNYFKPGKNFGVSKSSANLRLTAMVDIEIPHKLQNDRTFGNMKTSWGAKKKYSPYKSQTKHKDISIDEKLSGRGKEALGLNQLKILNFSVGDFGGGGAASQRFRVRSKNEPIMKEKKVALTARDPGAVDSGGDPGDKDKKSYLFTQA